MERILYISIIGSLVGVLGTGIGGLMAVFIKSPGDKFLSFMLGFSGGIMLTIVCFDLLPESFQRGDLKTAVLGIIIGVLVIIIIDDKIIKVNNSQGFIKMGLLIGLGVALHNFPEGLAIGSGFMAAKELGIGISLVIALHNIPEGLSMAAPMRAGGLKGFKVFLYTLLVGIPMGLGALIGALLGEISQFFIAFCLSLAGGTMLYIVCGELIPSSNKMYIGRIGTWGFLLGFLLGLIMTN